MELKKQENNELIKKVERGEFFIFKWAIKYLKN